MVVEGGWLARVARRFGELVGGRQDEYVGPAAETGVETFHEEASSLAEPAWSRPPPADSGAAAFRTPPPAAPTASVEPAILPDPNGRYVVGGFSFSSAEQAIEYRETLERRVIAASRTSLQAQSIQATPAPIPPQRASVPRESLSGSRWIGERTALTAGGHAFHADMVYFGTPGRYEGRHDHSRIDPVLPVDVRSNAADALLDYWPSYLGLKPQSRRRYLEWLSAGREDRSIPIGYVFLFFYGLEQRLLVDDAREDAEAIFAEVRRLLGLHGEHHSFHGYASRLLAMSSLYEDQDEAPPTPACAVGYDLELPLDLRVRLGRKLRDAEPFDAGDALRWVLALPDVYLRTPGQRCFDELRALWTLRFAARHPAGLVVRKPRSVVKHEYRAASGKFSVTVAVDNLPDISGTSAPLGPLRAMLDTCMEDLSAYSRMLGRDPDARGRLRGDLLLPAELQAERRSLETCRAALATATQDAIARELTVLELARILEIEVEPGGDKLPAAVVRQLAQALDALDHGCEPDRRYGPAVALKANARVSVFEGAGGAPVDHERTAYAEARGMVEVAVLAAAADGEVVASEMAAIERRLRATPDLAEHEADRLLAYGRSLAADPPKVRAALKRLGDVAPDRRAALAASAVDAVLADGKVEPGEVKFLEALHTALGLPATSLYSALHRGGADVDAGPVLVVEGVPDRTVPLPSHAPGGAVVSIDVARLERIRGETSKVSQLLATIFVEEEPEATASAPAPRRAGADSQYEGLDGPHAELLARLLSGPLGRAEFEVAASALRLMPDGAIEALNEWGFDRMGEAIVEDDDEVRLAEEAMVRIPLMGVAA